MATSKYFNYTNHRGTQKLINDLVVEMIQQRGIDVKYIPRAAIDKNPILNESNHLFKEAYDIEVYIENYEGFNDQMWEKFGGIQLQDNITFLISQTRFAEVIGNGSGVDQQPQEGDLIYLPLADKMFKLNNPNNDANFMQFGKFYVYSLPCVLFQYGNEEFETGDTDIDDISSRLADIDGDGAVEDASLQSDNQFAPEIENGLSPSKLHVDFGD